MGTGEGRNVGRVLGVHDMGRQVLVLTQVDPEATEIRLEGRRRMTRCSEGGVYAWLGDRASLPRHYRIRWTDRHGDRHERVDPYCLQNQLAWADRSDFWSSRQHTAETLGATPAEVEGIAGVQFAVWAPRALGARVTLPDGSLPLRHHPVTGVWSLFVPGIPLGCAYGFALDLVGGRTVWHTDPWGRRFEPRPGWRALVSTSPRTAAQNDRPACAAVRPRAVSVYELHLGSFLRRPAESASYAALAERVVRHVAPLGFTHVELLPITEHPHEGSWGYQVTGYHAPTHRHGPPEAFRDFVDRVHRAGLKVILDWVPGHFAGDAAALADFDGAPLYEHADPEQGHHHGWGTRAFDLGRPQVRAFLLASARHFLRDYGIDGLRLDAVAAMLYRDYDRPEGRWSKNRLGGRERLEAIDFLRELTTTLHDEFPDVLLIAEDSSLFPGVTHPVSQGGLGFDYKWNLGWMHDSLRYFSEDPLFRRHHHAILPAIADYSRRERGLLALSHDEVVHGKRSLYSRMPGDDWQRLANLRLLLTWQWTHPGAKLLFMGAELANPDEWDHQQALPWDRLELPGVQGLLRLIGDLNRLYRECPALNADDMDGENLRFIACHDALRSVTVFERKEGDQRLVILLNATPVVRECYSVGLPGPGVWHEIFNSDSCLYGGSNVGNLGAIVSKRDPAMGEPYSATVRLPPLGALILAPSTSPSSELPVTHSQGAAPSP